MNRRILSLIAILTALPLTASAQNESTTVIGRETMTGFWSISLPVNYMSTEMRDVFCRIQQTDDDLSARCLAWYGKGSGEVDGNRIRLAWMGVAGIRSGGLTIPLPVYGGGVLNGTLDSKTSFTGSLHVEANGLSFGQEAEKGRPPSLAKKLLFTQDVPDKAGKAKLLTSALTELAQGPLRLPHDKDFVSYMGFVDPNTTREIRDLGAIEAIIYLGEGIRPRPQPEGKPALPPLPFSAYQVEFENGQRLCGIHQRDDGVLDGFLCV